MRREGFTGMQRCQQDQHRDGSHPIHVQRDALIVSMLCPFIGMLRRWLVGRLDGTARNIVVIALSHQHQHQRDGEQMEEARYDPKTNQSNSAEHQSAFADVARTSCSCRHARESLSRCRRFTDLTAFGSLSKTRSYTATTSVSTVR